jgi:hypothetical protein
MKLRFALLAMLLTVLGVAACRDPLEINATIPTSTDTLTVYALTGTPPSYPNALSITARQVVPVSGFGGFDVAFDIDAAGTAIIHAARRVVSSGPFVPQVGLQKVPGTFESILEAPSTGYKVDTTLIAVEGEVIVLEAAHNNDSQDLCTFALSPYVYAKISIDSIFVRSRTIKLRLGYDPNCGYRSFAPGIPTR